MPEAKVTEYLLKVDHPEGCSKARFFLGRGFRLSDWEAMADCLRVQANGSAVADRVAGIFGVKFVMDGTIPCPDGSAPLIRTVWIVAKEGANPRLVTAHPMG